MMKYSFLMLLFMLTFSAQASYCSSKSWQDTYQLYTQSIDSLNTQIDRYNILLNKSHLPDKVKDKQAYSTVQLVIEELDQLSVDVEGLTSRFNKVKQLWVLISEHCLMDDELDYNNKAVENAQGADIGRQEVNDLLTRIQYLREHLFKLIELVSGG